MLGKLEAEPVFVRKAADFRELHGLILPGGESTTQWKLLKEEGLLDLIREFANSRGAIFGTCAGVILLARQVVNPPQESLGIMDLAVRRNAYGRQLASRVRAVVTTLGSAPVEMVFIRAPKIERFGAGVEVLAEIEGEPVLVRQDRLLGATFHPELTGSGIVHEYFLQMALSGAR